eukprot:COSAG01_NODE_9073_length_2564_cov_2.011765_1_plen_129_part_00
MSDATPAPEPEPDTAAAAPAAAGEDAEEEEVKATWESKYKDLKEVKVESGEENEDILFKMRCKMFHFKQAEEKYGGQMEWKEKGIGTQTRKRAAARRISCRSPLLSVLGCVQAMSSFSSIERRAKSGC